MKQIRVTFAIAVGENYKDVKQGKVFLVGVGGEVYRVPHDSVIKEEFLPGYFMLCDDEESREVGWVDSPEDFRVNSAVYRRVSVTFAG